MYLRSKCLGKPGEGSGMRYLYVKWIHKDPGAPVHLYSEIGDDSYERRKVEI